MSYDSLLTTLDALRTEAPETFKSYHPRRSNLERMNQARARALIHLFLKVRFGILDFNARHALICEGAQDGGVDAYYIDPDTRIIYLLQSKFRATEKNFEEKEIIASALLKMEIGRISRGELTDSNGVHFSSRIRELQKRLTEIRDIALYAWKVVLLANLKTVNDEQLRRLIDNMDYEVYDYSRIYQELVFPLTTGTYFKPSEVIIAINLGKKIQPQLSQIVATPHGPCNVRMIFVPILEIARITAKYKNSLLRFNPRNFLSLKKNPVNKSIRDTVLNTSQNEFSLRNNGITVLADYSSVTDRTGTSGEGQLIIKDPQILNGGQTATTLAMILEDENAGSSVFAGKEVLLKIIEKPTAAREDDLLEFIETISDATNKQSRIVEADRRASDPRMLALQEHFFDRYGLFLERKRGEFQYGMDSKVISKKQVIGRVALLRAVTAFDGFPAQARSSEEKIFEEERFDSLLSDFDLGRITRAHFSLEAVGEMNKAARKTGGPRVSAGKYALVYATSRVRNDKASLGLPAEEQAKVSLQAAMERWWEFEEHVKTLRSNAKYQTKDGFAFDAYYKGSNVADDVAGYKWE